MNKVEQRARELLAKEAFCDEHELNAALKDPYNPDNAITASAAVRAIATALSQQPEARGVVDDRVESILHKLNEWSRAYPEDIFREPSKEEREWLHTKKPGLMDRVSASMGRHMVRLIRDDLAALTAALTGERNV